MPYEAEESIEEKSVKATTTASYLAFSGLFTLIVYGLAFVAIARLLGPSNYGAYVVAVSVAGAFGAVGNFGIATYLERSIPKTKNSDELQRLIGSSIATILLLGTIIVLIGLAFSHYLTFALFHSFAYFGVLVVAIVSIVFSMLYGVGHGALIGFNDGKGSTIASIVYTVSQAAVSVTLVWLGFGVMGAVLGLFAGLSIGSLAVLWRIRKHAPIALSVKEFRERMKSIFSFSLPIAGSNFFSSLPSNIGVLLLAMYVASSTIGDYGVASRVESILGIFTGSMVVLLPFFSSLNLEHKKETSEIVSYMLYLIYLFATPFVVFFVMFSHPIMYTVFPRYEGVYVYIAIMSASLLISILGAPASSIVVSKAKVKKVFAFSAVVGLAELALLVLLIPYFTIYALIGVLYFVGPAIADFLYLHEIGKDAITVFPRRIYRIAFANLLLVIVFMPVLLISMYPTLKLAVAFALLFIAYPPIIGLTKAVGKRDIKRIETITSRVPMLSGMIRAVLNYAALFAAIE
jgi:O-antigen/teichoic acid export membrane protein